MNPWLSANVTVDPTTNIAVIDLHPGRAIARTVEVGASLLANYDIDGMLVSIEILSLDAVRRPEVADELRGLLAGL